MTDTSLLSGGCTRGFLVAQLCADIVDLWRVVGVADGARMMLPSRPIRRRSQTTPLTPRVEAVATLLPCETLYRVPEDYYSGPHHLRERRPCWILHVIGRYLSKST